MGNSKCLSSCKMIFVSAIALSSGIAGTLIGKLFGAALRTSPAWVGPAMLICSIALIVVGVLLLPTAIRELRVSNRGPAA